MLKKDFRQYYPATDKQYDQLNHYTSLLQQWNRRVNLIGSSTVEDIWHRHIVDCTALIPHLSHNSLRIADLGSGAGLPGIILAILTNNHITLIESLAKKAAFLQEVCNQLKLDYTVVNARIEDYEPAQNFDLITARAVADLSKLWQWSNNIRSKKSIGLFLKGENAQEEFPLFRKNHPNAIISTSPHPFGNGYIVQVETEQLK